MKPSLSLAWSYLKNLGKKWILWLFLVLDLIAVIIQIFIPSFALPQGIYIGIAILGLLWAGFETYLDLLSKIPSEARPLQPEIVIVFEEGNEYSYRFRQVEDIFPLDQLEFYRKVGAMDEQERDLEETTLPKSFLSLHVRIENIGLVAVNILTIGGDIDLDKPYEFMVPEAHNRDSTTLSYPVLLKPKEKLPLTVVVPIYPFSLFTDAQVAARTRNLRETKTAVEATIFAEVIDPNGKIHKYRTVYQVSILPLCDMYISHWGQLNKKHLVALALGETSPETGDNQTDEHASQAGPSQQVP
jgi:hypothetical protein